MNTDKYSKQPFQRVKQRLVLLTPSIERGTALLLMLILAAAAALFLFSTIQAVTFPYPLDYGEAPLVDQAMRLVAGQNIYRPDLSSPPYTIANYPPLYVLSLAALLKIFGISFQAGRFISFLCALVSAGFLGLTIHTHTKDRMAAAVAGMLFLAIPYVVQWSGLVRIDLLAVAFSAAGLYVISRWPTGRWGVIISALLLVAAIYTRQSYGLAAPLAIFVWLLTINWRQAIKFAAVVGGLSLGIFVFLNAITHGGFFFNIVTANINEFSMDRLTWNLRRYRDAVPFLLVLGGIIILFGHRRFHAWPLLTMYLIGSSITTLTIGKIGSNVNYFLELSAALCLVAGAVIAMCRQYRWMRAVIAVGLALQVGHLMRLTLDDFSEILQVRIELFDEIEQLERIVAESEGPVLADEFMGLITLQGQPLFIQPFEITQLVNDGILDQKPIIENIISKDFPAILIYHLPEFDIFKERWTPEMLEAVEQNYTLTYILADTYVYQTRRLYRNELAEIQVCPSSSWKLPTSALLGIAWHEDGINFYGGGSGKSVPVYSVAGGLLTRPTDSSNIV